MKRGRYSAAYQGQMSTWTFTPAPFRPSYSCVFPSPGRAGYCLRCGCAAAWKLHPGAVQSLTLLFLIIHFLPPLPFSQCRATATISYSVPFLCPPYQLGLQHSPSSGLI